MKTGGRILATVASLAMAGCGGEPGKLSIRATASPIKQERQPLPARIAEAQAQLALGNVGLALEAYRKAVREDPASTLALAGLADCYDRMGRFDVSRRYYEQALAMSPGDVALLAALSESLRLQGRSDEAAALRTEIAERLAAAVPPAEVQGQTQAGAQPPAPASAAANPEPVAIAAVESSAATAPVRLVAAQFPELPAAAANPGAEAAATPAPARSVTVKLPPPRPAVARIAAAPVQAPEPPAPSEAPTPSFTAQPASRLGSAPPIVAAKAEPLRPRSGPRLERLSLGEVALITTGKPQWLPTVVARSERSTTVRFVPLAKAQPQFVQVRLLNAARVERLAARTRSSLLRSGFAWMRVGNAPQVRSASVIFYPHGQRMVAERLSARLGFPALARPKSKEVIVLLGRDAAPALVRRG